MQQVLMLKLKSPFCSLYHLPFFKSSVHSNSLSIPYINCNTKPQIKQTLVSSK